MYVCLGAFNMIMQVIAEKVDQINCIVPGILQDNWKLAFKS